MPKARVTMDVKVGIDNMKALTDALKALATREVVVGYPEGKDKPREDGNLNNATLAYIMTKGSPARNVAPAPFIDLGIKDAEIAIQARLKTTAQNVLKGGSREDVEKGLTGIGLLAQAAVKMRAVNGPWDPLRPATLRGRKNHKPRQYNGTKRLIASGEMVAALNFATRNRPGFAIPKLGIEGE